MRLLVFLTLFAACLVLWTLGARVALVFSLALAAWIAFALVLYPKIRTYKVAMGIDDKLVAEEAAGWRWLVLHLAGLKVLALGFLTSMMPFLGSALEWASSQKLDFFFDPANPALQQKVMFVIGAAAFVIPFLQSWLHVGAIKDAALAEPKG